MQPMFEALAELLKKPVRSARGVKTDQSILLIYPPDRELDFQEQLLDHWIHALEAQGVDVAPLDLCSFIFDGLNDEAVETLQEEERDDYRWMVQGMSQRVESRLIARLEALASERAGTNIILYNTVSVFPLVRFGEVLRGLRDLDARIVVAFPGEERGGRLHFMNQPDGGNYLAVKLFWQ